jgi:hypothetical protein
VANGNLRVAGAGAQLVAGGWRGRWEMMEEKGNYSSGLLQYLSDLTTCRGRITHLASRTARGISEVISRPKQDREPSTVNQYSNPTMTTI